jgi:hypothetical protein
MLPHITEIECEWRQSMTMYRERMVYLIHKRHELVMQQINYGDMANSAEIIWYTGQISAARNKLDRLEMQTKNI